MAIDTTATFEQFLGKTIRSKSSIGNTSGMAYFWAKFTENGISYGAGTESTGSFIQTTFLAKSALSTKVAQFEKNTTTGQEQKGTITFEVDAGNTLITNIKVYFESGTSYDGETIECQFVNE